MEGEKSSLRSIPNLPLPATRPNSMVVKKVCPREFIPPHIVAEAMSTLHGLDLRWSGPITPAERQYVEQYVLAKYPQYSQGLVEESDKNDLYSIYYNNGGANVSPGERRRSPMSQRDSSPSLSPSSSLGGGHHDLDRTQLDPSRLLDLLTKKTSFPGSFVSIPEIQARNRVLSHCGLSDDDYLVLFAPTPKDAMMLVGESYPFFKHSFYLTVIEDADADCIREFAAYKEARVVSAPADWLDLRIKGSQLSQYFRRKSKYSPKGLFAYAVEVLGTRYSLHWVSEAHRNKWHVLLDATALAVGKQRLSLALHRPDFVLFTIDDTRAQQQPSMITCLLVRKKSFDTTASPPPQL